ESVWQQSVRPLKDENWKSRGLKQINAAGRLKPIKHLPIHLERQPQPARPPNGGSPRPRSDYQTVRPIFSAPRPDPHAAAIGFPPNHLFFKVQLRSEVSRAFQMRLDRSFS